ncbi:MAG: HAMP domain-containing protein [Desulfobacula sp.]|nr:HAMP domain-containing protein [Desulfobacula sp.]
MKFSNKLSFAVLATGMIVLILLSSAIYVTSYNSIIKSQSLYTQSIANEISDDIDQLLYEKVKTALTLANTPILKKVLETSNVSYVNLSDKNRKKSIKLLNEKWKSIKDPNNNFILKFTDNKVSHFLKSQQASLKGEYGEIFLTDKFGALVSSTARLSTFAHGHKYWWLRSYNNGRGAVFFDDRGYDDSVGGYVLGLVVPVRKGGEIIGILKCNLNILGSISKLISGAQDKLLGKFKLTRSGGMIVFEEGYEPLSTQVHDDIYKRLKTKNNEIFILNDSGAKYLVGFSELKLTKGQKGYGFGGTFESIDHKKGNTGESWYVLCCRQMDVVTAPIIESIRSVLIIGTAIILILVLVSYLFGRMIAKPIAILDKATEKIGKGDFKYRIDFNRNDEFGKLGRSFNAMASTLDQTTTSIELLENEIIDRKQAEKEREKLIKKLQAALENVKTLSGLLPICARCKKIRDDKGYWNNLEVYLQSHSDILFSHGMCSQCSDELYGKQDWYMKMKKKQD